MKISIPESTKVRPISQFANGEPFMKDGSYFIKVRINNVHDLPAKDCAWAVRIEDGLLTKFGTDTRVQVADAEFTVKM